MKKEAPGRVGILRELFDRARSRIDNLLINQDQLAHYKSKLRLKLEEINRIQDDIERNSSIRSTEVVSELDNLRVQTLLYLHKLSDPSKARQFLSAKNRSQRKGVFHSIDSNLEVFKKALLVPLSENQAKLEYGQILTSANAQTKKFYNSSIKAYSFENLTHLVGSKISRLANFHGITSSNITQDDISFIARMIPRLIESSHVELDNIKPANNAVRFHRNQVPASTATKL